jgi:drug/metabolite transporter (DMT)-like permease
MAMVLVMVAWGSTFVVTKVAATEIPPLTLAFLRFAIATVALLPVAWARGAFRRMTRPVAIAPLIWMAITGIAFFTVAFNYGLVHATATQGALIYALGRRPSPWVLSCCCRKGCRYGECSASRYRQWALAW